MKSFLTFAAMILIAACFEELGYKVISSAVSSLAVLFIIGIFLFGWEPFGRDKGY